LEFIIEPGVTCYAVRKADWDRNSVEGVVLHKVKEVLVFKVEHLVCDPDFPDSAGAWKAYAHVGWYGFLRAGAWVILAQRTQVKRT
jgi:hypothetical protein